MNAASDIVIDNGQLNEQKQPPDWLLLEDGPLIAVNKPAGILTEGVPLAEQTMVGLVKAWLAEKYQKAGNVYLGIPHRPDRATSGTLVFTRNSKAAARVAEQFEKRQVTKIYWALLENRPEAESGLLVDWLLKVPDQAISEVVRADTVGAKEARLEYRTLRQIDGRWLVEVQLLTGRMHQIRAQFASRGCPVVGDTKYGAGEWLDKSSMNASMVEVSNNLVTDVSDGTSEFVDNSIRKVASDIRIALHARSLSLLHPIRYNPLTIETPVPAYWNLSDESFLRKLQS